MYHTLVAHGKNSGAKFAKSFSNKFESKQSSLGLFVTGNTYQGGKGYALNLYGLEKGINDHAYKRRIVIHGADYVSENFIKKVGRLGRSWGCPSLDKKISTPLINEIKDGSFVFAYYPDKPWLSSSEFL